MFGAVGWEVGEESALMRLDTRFARSPPLRRHETGQRERSEEIRTTSVFCPVLELERRELKGRRAGEREKGGRKR